MNGVRTYNLSGDRFCCAVSYTSNYHTLTTTMTVVHYEIFIFQEKGKQSMNYVVRYILKQFFIFLVPILAYLINYNELP